MTNPNDAYMNSQRGGDSNELALLIDHIISKIWNKNVKKTSHDDHSMKERYQNEQTQKGAAQVPGTSKEKKKEEWSKI